MATAAFIVLGLVVLSAEDLKPTVELQLDEKGSSVRVGDEIQKIDARLDASDGELAAKFGSTEGISFKFEQTSKEGAIYCRFLVRQPKVRMKVARYILTLRGERRTWVGFAYYPNDPHLYGSFRYASAGEQLVSRDGLMKFNTWYDGVVTYDGLKAGFYLNGQLQAEQRQSIPGIFPAGSMGYLGPFKPDALNETSKIWEEDNLLVSKMKLYDKALSPAAIAALSNIKVDAKAQGEPALLTIAKTFSAPKVDGVLNEDEWIGASGFISLIDAERPFESLNYPSGNAQITYDSENLYIGFNAHFPRMAKIIMGEIRADREPEVWGHESFEVYISKGKDLYRFAGNVAGGFTEFVNRNYSFNGGWIYKASLRKLIDDTEVWNGEMAIPFKTLEMAVPPKAGETLKLNFARTWRALSPIGITSFSGRECYDDVGGFITLRFGGEDVAAVKTTDHNNPNFGHFHQNLDFFAGGGGTFNYSVALVDSQGLTPSEKLFDRIITLKPRNVQKFKIDSGIGKSCFDTLELLLLDASGKTLQRQRMPFKISADYMDIKPVFSSGFIQVHPLYDLLTNSLGGNPQISIYIQDFTGKVIASQEVSSGSALKLPFERKNPEGAYKVVLSSIQSGKSTNHTEKQFYYPGIQPFENEQFDRNVLLPPYTAMKYKSRGQLFQTSVWGRTYSWKGSLLPSSVTSRTTELLGGPIELLIDGKKVDAPISVTKQSPVRMEFASSVNSETYDLSMNSWAEYDGVIWNEMQLIARSILKEVKLRFIMPEKIAPFFHATRGGMGDDGGFTSDTRKTHELGFYPVVWLGDHEKGLCWFAETGETWRNNGKFLKIFRENGKVVFEALFGVELEEGSSLDFSFGFLASPLKPLPSNYPLNIFADPNRLCYNEPPPKAPVSELVLVLGQYFGLGFYDLPHGSTKYLEELKASVDKAHNNHARAIPYLVPCLLPDEYPVANAYKDEWQTDPVRSFRYELEKATHTIIWGCPGSKAANYYQWRIKDLLSKVKLDGLYFDFGPARYCRNPLHGCNRMRYPLLAMRDFYRGMATLLVQSGIKNYVIMVHNSMSVQLPAFTFVTHLHDGEHFRQKTSEMYHNGKDILDTLTITDFSSEFSSMPWGLTASIYMADPPLDPLYGGGKEEDELYAFRMNKAFLAGTLVHNTIPSLYYGHSGLNDKLVRAYNSFGVPNAEFIPYWKNPGLFKVTKGKDIYVSAYRPKDGRKELLLVISHVGKEHLDQEVAVDLDLAKFGFSKILSAEEQFTKDDPDYKRFHDKTRQPSIPIKLGDFGIDFKGFEDNGVKLLLKHHSVAIVRLKAE